ncbi:unnamed protein product [Clonostachys chloroleuca]|uniref:Uncharacterized protein n=1 Tax=Clonostachys chloroleuca TaxID=1926264 RepID=A0AA35M7A6_9HYPO|nr:unnamed protein product [Clonostachys chloroleuca]
MLSKILRAAGALPLLLVAAWSFQTMDLDKIAATAAPSALAKTIEWKGGKVKIIDFHGIAFLDDLWRGGTATFSVSSFGYDSIAAWQVFTFLIDLGPIYAIWILESTRGAHKWSPAYIPTLFSVAAQVLGIGSVAPIFYFLCIVFGPSASSLAVSTPQRRTVWHQSNLLLIPIVLVLHTSEIFGMFFAQSYDARHYWTWAWQLSPLWIGLANIILGQAIRLFRVPFSPSAASKLMLGILAVVSASVWIYTVAFSPHSIPTLFFPETGPQDGLILHSRKALQADEVAAYASTFLWLIYAFADLYLAGLVGTVWVVYAALLPLVTLAVGPGATYVLGWYARESILSSARPKGN